MSRRLDYLFPDFEERVREALSQAEQSGIDVLVYCTLRTIHEQAKLWRQSRTRAQIEDKIAKLQERGLDFLANAIITVGPQYGATGKHVTYAGPGESFHNYGLAFDGVVLVGGKPDWNMEHPAKWETWGTILEANGITWAGRWVRFREFVHGQDGEGQNPLKRYTPDQISRMLDDSMKVAVE